MHGPRFLKDHTPESGRSNLSLKICRQPVFIIGSPRSGTSILAMSLAHHDRLWTSQESDLLFNLFGSGHVERAFEAARNRPEGSWLSEQHVEMAEFWGYLGAGLNALFTSRSGKKRWVDQTPLNTLMVEILADMFPDALFLHILRDSRRVVHSMIHFADSLPQELKGKFIASGFLPEWATGFRQACQTWRLFIERAIDFCTAHPDRCLTVVNEKLAAEPKAAFKKIFNFLRIRYQDGPVNFFQSSRLNSSFGPNVWGTPAAQDEPAQRPVVSSPSEPWKEWLPDQNAIFLEEVVPTLSKYRLVGPEQLGQLLS
ncbi:MAG: sulfotransferase [Acidobacteria bacterium]|nr:sulfotransferase [Acidobacteriota bacterium]